MDKNSFVSIYFTQNKLLIVKLNKSKKGVDIFAAIDLPQGLIQNHEVKDVKALADVLKSIWHKLKIKEKSIGIVIPEFSTFTKAMDLPKLDREEINEAVKWQAEEYIPLDPEQMLLDWRIISEKPEGIRILAVAVGERLLKGYVAASDAAGLFPLVVETPSLSLMRLVGDDEDLKMVIYFSLDEIIIFILKGQEILTSSVIGASSSSQVLSSTIARILRYFEETKITKIFIGGVPGNNAYVSDIFNNFKIPMEKLHIKISGINENDFQKYSIPISLQYTNTSEPTDSETINLLPPEVITKYKGKRFGVQLWGLLLVTTLIFVGCLMALLGTYFYLLQGLSKYKNISSLSDISYQKSKTASDEIKKVNTLADVALKIDSVTYYPQEILNNIYKYKPEGVAVLSYTIDLEKGLIKIKGLSAGRVGLLEFKNKLEEGEDFQNVELPISSFEQGENIDFDMSFIYSELISGQTKK
ncbi:MAG: PilM [Candidatus Woesebacteria bacterium GW2011_GWC1_38_13]|uniref:PilM n=2 Tax=Candidatus Woeseibacteriota TaxID=1752722 RepID=A0A0G0L815_9BACT|nr:MAG: PilM [Candidatus Woesebacteria bacterium GW2011_GWC1_38_13]KKQ84025.1 MAG: PilM [Candidatus Woesebacteria bacterium GW2011_GWA1_38_8]